MNDLEPKRPPSNRLLLNCRREFGWMIAFWLVCFAWVVGYGWLAGYPASPAETHTAWGMPAWVVYGVFLPWLLATLFTIWFAMRVMADDSLES